MLEVREDILCKSIDLVIQGSYSFKLQKNN